MVESEGMKYTLNSVPDLKVSELMAYLYGKGQLGDLTSDSYSVLVLDPSLLKKVLTDLGSPNLFEFSNNFQTRLVVKDSSFVSQMSEPWESIFTQLKNLKDPDNPQVGPLALTCIRAMVDESLVVAMSKHYFASFEVPDSLVDSIGPYIKSMGFPVTETPSIQTGCTSLSIVGPSALDFLGVLYEKANYYYQSSIEKYLFLCGASKGAEVSVTRLSKDAILPSKKNISDSGYDVCLTGIKSQVDDNTFLFSTGLQVDPPPGFYLDLLPRSSLGKTGWTMPHGTGVIDMSYRGEVMVLLRRLSEEIPIFEFPARVVQLIPRPISHFRVVEKDALAETKRGEGGYGSTGV